MMLDEIIEAAKDLAKEGEETEAISLLDQGLSTHANSPPLLLLKARVYDRLGLFDQALKYFDLAIYHDSSCPEAFYYRAVAYCTLPEYRDRALSDFEKAVELRPGYVDALEGASLARFALGNLGDAVHYASRAVEVCPTSGEAYYLLGNALLAIEEKDSEELDEAIEALTKSVELSPESATSWLALGRAYLERKSGNDLSLADHALSQAIAAAPAKPRYWVKRGQIRREMQDYVAALADYREAFARTDKDDSSKRDRIQWRINHMKKKMSSDPDSGRIS